MKKTDISINEKKIIAWGASSCFENRMKLFPYNIIQYSYIVDNNSQIWGKNLYGLEVKNPNELYNENMEEIKIIIFSTFYKEIINQLHEMKIECEIINAYESSDIDPYQKISYSATGEDRIIEDYFNRIGIQKPTYLEIGTNHPKGANNTYLFYLKGSRGVLVEPDPEFSEVIKETRPEDVYLQIGIGGKKGTAELYVIDKNNAYNTFVEGNKDYLINNVNQKVKDIITVSMLPINEVIEKYFDTYPDYISMDIEGMELEVLRTFDFEKYKTKVFCIETCCGECEEINKLFEQNGYKIYAMNSGNTVYVQK